MKIKLIKAIPREKKPPLPVGLVLIKTNEAAKEMIDAGIAVEVVEDQILPDAPVVPDRAVEEVEDVEERTHKDEKPKKRKKK